MRAVKRYCVVLVMFLAIVWVGCETEGPDDYKEQFIKYYGGDGDQEAKDFIVNPDGTVVMVGTSIISNSKKIYVVKANQQGEQLWSLELGAGSNETGQDIERIISGPDAGNYLIVSNVEKSFADSLAIRLTVISENGDSLKSSLIDRFESQEARSLTVLSSGQYFLTGKVLNSDTLNAELPGFDLEDSFVMLIGNDLSLITPERTGGSTLTSGIKIIDKPNSINYAMYSDELKIEKDFPLDRPDQVHEVNFVFRKLDKADESNKRSFYAGDTIVNEYLADIDQSSFSGIFLAVGTQVDPADISTSTLYACTINSNYSKPLLIQGKIKGGPTRAEGVAVGHALEDNFFWVLGNEILAGGENRSIWVGKVDASNLSTVYSRKFGGSNNDDTGSKILQLDNGDVLILGTMELVNQKKIALIKIKENGSF